MDQWAGDSVPSPRTTAAAMVRVQADVVTILPWRPIVKPGASPCRGLRGPAHQRAGPSIVTRHGGTLQRASLPRAGLALTVHEG